jgi:uncharacterized membrane protein
MSAPFRFLTTMLRNIWIYLAIGSVIFTYLPLPVGWRRFFLFGTAVLFVISAYRTAWVLQKQSEAEKKELRGEIERLKIKPYDEAHRKLTADKLQKIAASEKELLRFLLHHGRVEAADLQRACGLSSAAFNQAIQALRREQLVSDVQEKPNPDRASVTYFWQVNPEFRDALQDLLYPQNG